MSSKLHYFKMYLQTVAHGNLGTVFTEVVAVRKSLENHCSECIGLEPRALCAVLLQQPLRKITFLALCNHSFLPSSDVFNRAATHLC